MTLTIGMGAIPPLVPDMNRTPPGGSLCAVAASECGRARAERETFGLAGDVRTEGKRR